MNINKKWIFIAIAAIIIVGVLYFGQDSIFNFKKNPKITGEVQGLTSSVLITNEQTGLLMLKNSG
ncbi:MAG TPA: hypothetical protein PLP47_01840, partial [Methanofastidiosum sp.]|nr:hypothetical protein [Methanofastidiosum sp.]